MPQEILIQGPHIIYYKTVIKINKWKDTSSSWNRKLKFYHTNFPPFDLVITIKIHSHCKNQHVINFYEIPRTTESQELCCS